MPGSNLSEPPAITQTPLHKSAHLLLVHFLLASCSGHRHCRDKAHRSKLVHRGAAMGAGRPGQMAPAERTVRDLGA